MGFHPTESISQTDHWRAHKSLVMALKDAGTTCNRLHQCSCHQYTNRRCQRSTGYLQGFGSNTPSTLPSRWQGMSAGWRAPVKLCIAAWWCRTVLWLPILILKIPIQKQIASTLWKTTNKNIQVFLSNSFWFWWNQFYINCKKMVILLV